jgi:hypothetical protein
LGTEACNIHVQPLQHLRYTFATSARNTCNVPLTSETLETYLLKILR